MSGYNKALKIDLTNQGLTEFPTELLRYKNLRKLNLSHNKIKFLPKEINKLKYLKVLDVSHNPIKVLYANTCELPFLEVLIANNNQLKRFPEQIDRLQKLRKLSLANNHLEELPNSIHLLRKLQLLDIANNRFKELPDQIFYTKTLTHLWLSKNTFNEFSAEKMVKELPNLTHVYCFGATTDSIENINNDYAVLQQKKGNCLGLLKLLAKNSDLYTDPKIMNTKRKIFISYSHRDKEYKEEVEVWLKGIQYIGFEFKFWSDTQILSGDISNEEIKTALAEAGIVINIISQYYLASEFIQTKELPTLLEKAEKEGTLILNLIARRCFFDKTLLAVYQAVNDPKRPIESEGKDGQNSIYLAMTQRIMKEFEKASL